jgi:hypothetical protein
MMIPIQHGCGLAEQCVADYVETGAEAWDTVQSANDTKKYLCPHINFVLDTFFDPTV